jgi:hypothetical protein
MTVRARFDNQWDRKLAREMDLGLLELVTDVDAKAKILAPKDTRALVNSAVISKTKEGYVITQGSSRVPYARRQYFENRTKSKWLETAAESTVRSNVSKYFRNK